MGLLLQYFDPVKSWMFAFHLMLSSAQFWSLFLLISVGIFYNNSKGIFFWALLASVPFYYQISTHRFWGLYFFLTCFFYIRCLREFCITIPLTKLVNIKKALSKVSPTEQIALEAGNTWVDKDLFSGNIKGCKIFNYKIESLTKEENDFLHNQVNEVCEMENDWDVFERKDLSPQVWDFLKQKKFFGMLIPKKYGGLEFSPIAQSTIVAKLATRSQVLGITVMVPNSLGPGELFLKYGTEKQKDYYLPRLADGREVPAFGLTEPFVGSDATSIRSKGIVFKKSDGKLGIRLNFEKRYITLGAVATVIGLAFKLEDPESILPNGVQTGITCAIIKGDAKGLKRGRRHLPLNVPFINSPLWGEDVEIDIEEDVIGGYKGCGLGWKMLMECLSVGRGISLPAISTGGSHFALRVATFYSHIRKQFNMPIIKFEGINEVLAESFALNYTCSAIRDVTASSVTNGNSPSVVNAIAKYHTTEIFRKIVNNSMDILGGAAICVGPKNLLAHGYMGAPIAITVEGANIMTRSLMQFGQGLVRCHPYSLAEITALSNNDTQKFDMVFWKHIGHLLSNATRTVVFNLTAGFLSIPSQFGSLYKWERKLKQASATFAFLSDIALITYGGSLKRMEFLSGKFADILSQMYIAYCLIIKFKNDNKQDKELFDYAIKLAFFKMQDSFDDVYNNLFKCTNPLHYIIKGFGLINAMNKLSLKPNKKNIDSIAKKFADIDFIKSHTNLCFTSYQDNDRLLNLEKCCIMYKKIETIITDINKNISINVYASGALVPLRKLRSAEDLIAFKDATDEQKNLAISYLSLLKDVVSVDHFELKTKFGL